MMSMYTAYLLNKSDFGYVYDDTDLACELLPLDIIKQLEESGVDFNISTKLSYIKPKSPLWAKLALFYKFKQCDYSSLEKILCSYYIGRDIFGLKLRVETTCCYAIVYCLGKILCVRKVLF